MTISNNFLKGILGIIPGEITLQDFSAVTQLNLDDCSTILNQFTKNNIGKKTGDKYYFESSDRLKAAIFLITQGVNVDDVSEHIDWKNFEGLIGEILSSKNFAVIKNLILTKPRMEIDVVGIRLGIAMLIDCKHWKRYTNSSLSNAVQKQIERTKHYVSKTEGSIAVPVIVTLSQDDVNFINKVPIVPISKFSSFVDEFYGNLEQMQTIEKD